MPTSSAPPPQAQRPAAVVSLSAAGHFFNDGYANIYPTLVPIVAQAMGFGLVSGALVITAVRMASSLLQPVFGALADQRPNPYFGPIALGVIGVATALLGFVHPAVAFVALALVAGAANGAYHPPSLALVRAVAGSQPGRFTSVFLVGGTAGRAVGPLLMVAAAALFGEAPGKVAAGLGGLVALTLVLVPPNPKALPGKGNEPAIVSFFQWLDKMMKDPPKSPPSITTHWATRPAPTRSTPGTYTPQTGKSTPKRAPGYPVGQGGQR